MRKFISLTVLIIVAYVTIQSFAINATVFPADDIQELVFVNGMRSWADLFGKDVFGLFRPVKNLLFLILSCFDQNDISFFRLFCVFIGILSFLPVLCFCRKVFKDYWFALVAASVWFLAPTLVSSCAWLSCVNIQIMTGLVAMSLCLHDDERPCGAAICIMLACLSYESAVAAGPIIVAYDFFLRPDRFRTSRAWRQYAAYALITIVYLLARTLIGSATSVNGSLAGLSRMELICASAYFTLLHFGIWLWPFGSMAVFGGYSTGQISFLLHVVCWLSVVSLVVSSFVLRKRAPRFAFGVAMAFLAFLPTSNILGIGNGPYGDYYLDVASIGLSIALVAIVKGLLSKSGRLAKFSAAIGLAVLFVRVCGVVESARWAYLWADGERAYISTLKTFPNAYYGHVVYAQLHCDQDDFPMALKHCDIAEQLIGSDMEKMWNVDIVRAICALRGEKNAEKALALLERCESECSSPSFIRSCHFYRGCVAEDLMGDLAFAQREYELAMPAKLGVDDIRTADRLARIYAMNGKVPAAIELWREALRVSPGDFSVMWNLSIALRKTGAINESNRLQERLDARIRCRQ